MSFFDSVKKSLGMSKDKSSDNAQGRPGLNYDQFEITFVEEKLGIGISKFTGDMPHLDPPPNSTEERSCPVVTSFESRTYDVKPGDLIVALEGNPISSFEDFTSIIKAVGRPVRIKFLRRHHQGQISSDKSSDKSSSVSAGSSLSAGIFRNFGGVGSAAAKAPAVVLSEEEKALRRERLSAAAQDRSKSWDKKLGQKKTSQSLNVPIVDGNAVVAEAAGSSNGTHADTERAIRKTKELEVRIEQQMGYNPFRPHMSFSSGGATATATSTSAATGATSSGSTVGGNHIDNGNGNGGLASSPSALKSNNNVAGLDMEAAAAAEEDAMAEVDDAFAMLLSLGESEQERGRVAVTTVSRMIQNLAAAPEDPKLRSIRVSNKAFQSKVAVVPGGAELLVAAGYAYRTCSTVTTTGGSSAANVGSGGTTDQVNKDAVGEGELFLVHDMDAGGRGKLHYTLSRIQELLESVSGAASPVSPRPQ